MNSRDFCFWLQGYLEITASQKAAPTLSSEQVECVQKHLAMVFAHDIDPQVPPKVAEVLDKIHHPEQSPFGPKPRC